MRDTSSRPSGEPLKSLATKSGPKAVTERGKCQGRAGR